jgi:hypothetical protein
VATATRDPVLRWAGYAQQAGKKYGIPPAVLLGLVRVESGGIEGRVSSANARGLTQFIPSTARAYGVDTTPGHARSQIEGAAKYLHDLGFNANPTAALNRYSGGAAGYPAKVLTAAKDYGGTTAAAAAAATPAVQQSAAPAANTGGGALLDDTKRSGALKALTTVAFVLGGALLVYLGINQASGGAVNRTAKTAATVAATRGAVK